MGILNFWNRKDIDKQSLIEHDVCPNCWSKEEYQAQFKAHNSHQSYKVVGVKKSEKLAFIQKFVHTHLPNISLNTATLNTKECSKCNGKFKY